MTTTTTEKRATARTSRPGCDWDNCGRTDTQPAILTLTGDDGLAIGMGERNLCPDHVRQVIDWMDANSDDGLHYYRADGER
jgi:hypothetical protein